MWQVRLGKEGFVPVRHGAPRQGLAGEAGRVVASYGPARHGRNGVERCVEDGHGAFRFARLFMPRCVKPSPFRRSLRLSHNFGESRVLGHGGSRNGRRGSGWLGLIRNCPARLGVAGKAGRGLGCIARLRSERQGRSWLGKVGRQGGVGFGMKRHRVVRTVWHGEAGSARSAEVGYASMRYVLLWLLLATVEVRQVR